MQYEGSQITFGYRSYNAVSLLYNYIVYLLGFLKMSNFSVVLRHLAPSTCLHIHTSCKLPVKSLFWLIYRDGHTEK